MPVLHAKQNKKMKRAAAHVDSALLATNVEDLQDAAVAVASADAGALGTVTVTAISAPVPDALTEAAPTTPANVAYTQADQTALADAVIELQVVVEALRVENVDLRARAAQVDTAIASLATAAAELITLANELKANFNDTQAAIDAL